MLKGFRSYYDKDLEYLLKENEGWYSEWSSLREAKRRLNGYATLFTRDMRKILLKDDSCCNFCESKEKLQIDHIIPVSKGGKNLIENTQILCAKCNRQKSNKLPVNV